MYVDNTDLLHWPSSPHTDPEELIAHIQQATTDYTHLAQASGGILKDTTCSVYILDYKFVGKQARMKTLRNLPAPARYITIGNTLCPSHITIPQPAGPDVPISTHDVTTASKMLGVHFSPAGNSLTHVVHMVQKGLDWVDCLRTKPLPSRDSWLSFHMPLVPGISWGMVMVCLHPDKLNSMFQKVYMQKHCLFLMSVVKSRPHGKPFPKPSKVLPYLLSPWLHCLKKYRSFWGTGVATELPTAIPSQWHMITSCRKWDCMTTLSDGALLITVICALMLPGSIISGCFWICSTSSC